jgi:hypothetical protein
MAAANKCDRCGTLYEPAWGTVHLERVGVTTKAGDTEDTWDGIDLCLECGEIVLVALGPAIVMDDDGEPQ